jgi:CHAT domain/NB-ARC domain
MKLPLVSITFMAPTIDEEIPLKLMRVQAQEKIEHSCTLKFPFALQTIPLILRALNARQYPDYPGKMRFLRGNEENERIIAQLRSLGLWEESPGGEEGGLIPKDVAQRVGQLLGEALLTPDVREALSWLYSTANEQGGKGEVLLSFDQKAAIVAALPWELTYDGLQPILMARGVSLNCVRAFRFDHPLSTVPEGKGERPLRMLTVAPWLSEEGRAFEELARLRIKVTLHDKPILIEMLPLATMSALYKRLDEGEQVDVIDFYGHGIFTEGSGKLRFDDGHGGRDDVEASKLTMLPKLPPLWVLHACQSGQTGMADPLAGVSAALSAGGVRVVVAMQLTIPMETATNIIIPTFYQALAAGENVQKAIASVRRKLYTTEGTKANWYLPVVYVQQNKITNVVDKPYYLFPKETEVPPNPFTGDGAYNDLKQFVGRKDVIDRLVDRLVGPVRQGGSNIAIVGAAGSGKSTMLSLIGKDLYKKIQPEPQVIWLSIQRSTKLVVVQATLARRLGNSKSRADDYQHLIEGKHIILLIDDVGMLDLGNRGLDIRLWLRGLSQQRNDYRVQLVTTSPRTPKEIFQQDEVFSEQFSPFHNVMADVLRLEEFMPEESQQLVKNALVGTPFQPEQFADIVAKRLTPRDLRAECQMRYDTLSKNYRSEE